MPQAKRSPSEEQELLLDNEADVDGTSDVSYPLYKAAVVRGVASHVGKWPSHLFAAFLAASLVLAAFILFAIVTALFCAPNVTSRCRKWRNVEFAAFPNVYFVKHASRTWSTRELCHVESTARENSDTNIYLINLLVESREGNLRKNESRRTEATRRREAIEILWEMANNSVDNAIVSSGREAAEARTRKRLDANYPNVRNVDVTIDDFFQGSMLAPVCRGLDVRTVEIAAKAYVLWNTPGVALEPHDSRYLRRLRPYLCREGCKTLKEAAINPEGSVQASGVACQAFVGCLMHEIANRGSSSEDRKIVNSARRSFCRSEGDCPGLEILNEGSRYSDQSPTSCPVTYPLGGRPTSANVSSARTSGLRPESATRQEKVVGHLR